VDPPPPPPPPADDPHVAIIKELEAKVAGLTLALAAETQRHAVTTEALRVANAERSALADRVAAIRAAVEAIYRRLLGLKGTQKWLLEDLKAALAL
jgi:hypothetical protein